MRMLLIGFLIAVNSACASIKDRGISLNWEFLENDEGEHKACLPQESVSKLREMIIRCEND